MGGVRYGQVPGVRYMNIWINFYDCLNNDIVRNKTYMCLGILRSISGNLTSCGNS